MHCEYLASYFMVLEAERIYSFRRLNLGLGTHSRIECDMRMNTDSFTPLDSFGHETLVPSTPLESLDGLDALTNLEPPIPRIATFAPLLQSASLPPIPLSSVS